MPSDPTRPGGPRYTRAQRRLLTALAGLIVAALAGGAYALTYDVLRELALAGRVGTRWAPLYPAMADTLTAMTILSLVITRNARWWTRLLRWALLLLLVAGGAALSVQHSVWGFAALPEDAVRAGVAVAPHVMLVIAVWLWLTMFKQIRVARPAAEETAPAQTQRGHVKVLEPAAPEPPALVEADPAPESPFAFLDDPEPEPLIPFPEPTPQPPADEPARTAQASAADESNGTGTTPRSPVELESAEEEPAAPEPQAREATEPERGTEEPAPPAPTAHEDVAAEESLSSEPAPPEDTPLLDAPHLDAPPLDAPPLDALPEPRPPLVPLPEPTLLPAALLPTDVELVRSRDRADAQDKRPLAPTTRPDIVMPVPFGADEEEHDTPPSDRAEDPDAGEHPGGGSGEQAGDGNPPPSGSFRSGPTPPAD